MPTRRPSCVECAKAMDRAGGIDDPPPRLVGHLVGNRRLVEIEVALPEWQPLLAVASFERADLHGSGHVTPPRDEASLLERRQLPTPWLLSQRSHSRSEPWKALRSTSPLMPATRPVAVYCQNVHLRLL